VKIVDLIQRDMIVPALQASDKRGILQELAKHIAGRIPKIDEANLARILIDREQLASTAIGEGVAIPHGKLGAVSEITACLGRVPGGVDFDSMDGQLTYLFFVLVAPETSTGAHLKALARISRVFKDQEFRRRLLAAPDAAAMYQVVAEEDAKY
jgi:PTS system nitrogen regulatory IIA component